MVKLTTEQARAIGCAIIEQAYEDIKNEHQYRSASRDRERLLDQQTALEFFRSEWFEVICQGCDLDAGRIRVKALT